MLPLSGFLPLSFPPLSLFESTCVHCSLDMKGVTLIRSPYRPRFHVFTFKWRGKECMSRHRMTRPRRNLLLFSPFLCRMSLNMIKCVWLSSECYTFIGSWMKFSKIWKEPLKSLDEYRFLSYFEFPFDTRSSVWIYPPFLYNQWPLVYIRYQPWWQMELKGRAFKF